MLEQNEPRESQSIKLERLKMFLKNNGGSLKTEVGRFGYAAASDEFIFVNGIKKNGKWCPPPSIHCVLSARKWVNIKKLPNGERFTFGHPSGSRVVVSLYETTYTLEHVPRPIGYNRLSPSSIMLE